VSPEFIAFFGRLEPPARATDKDQAPGEPRVSQKETHEGRPDGAQEPPVLAAQTEAPPERGCGILLCLMPFGVGQFANDQIVKGVIFAAAEAGFLATNIALYWAQSPDRFVDDGALAVQRVSLILFFATIAVGIADAYLFP
jgi:hypothetical protein